MAIYHPPEGVPRSNWARAARSAFFVTTLVLCGRASSGGELTSRPIEDLRIEQVSPSPDGSWVAVQSAGEGPREHRLWVVDLQSGLLKELVDNPPAGSPLAWEDGALRAEIADPELGRREMRWLDPLTHEVLRTARSTPLLDAETRAAEGLGWAGIKHLRLGRGRYRSEVEWLGQDRSFPVSDYTDLEWQITREPGVVFYATREAGVTAVKRWDMAREWSSEVLTLDGPDAAWQVSPDGLTLWVADGDRTRIVDALDGSSVAGPWRAGEVQWLQADGNRFCRLTVGGHHYVVDIDLDHKLHLGPVTGAETEVFVLRDDRFVLRVGDRLDLLDRDGRLLANLLPGGALATAAH